MATVGWGHEVIHMTYCHLNIEVRQADFGLMTNLIALADRPENFLAFHLSVVHLIIDSQRRIKSYTNISSSLSVLIKHVVEAVRIESIAEGFLDARFDRANVDTEIVQGLFST